MMQKPKIHANKHGGASIEQASGKTCADTNNQRSPDHKRPTPSPHSWRGGRPGENATSFWNGYEAITT